MMTFRNIFTIVTIGITFQLFGQHVGKDTIFVFKDTVVGELQTIFIDKNKDSEFYDRIANFNFQYFDNDSYKYSIGYFKEQKITLKTTKPVISWTNWVTLKQYKQQYYAYHPCDFLFHFRQSVNDSTFIDWTGEGPVANKIVEQKKINAKTYEFKLIGIYDQNRVLTIHILDKKKGIAIFEEEIGKERKVYLMIAANKIRSVPIIVNHCPTQKQTELEFDAIDLITK